MIQPPKSDPHYFYLQSILTKLLTSSAINSQTLILSNRTSHIIFSLLSESQITKCGFSKVILGKDINPYMDYGDVVVALTTSGSQDLQEVSQYSHRLHCACLLHFGLISPQNKSKLKQINWKDNSKIKSLKQQNIDFITYLRNVYILNASQSKDKKQVRQKVPKKNDKSSANNNQKLKSESIEETVIDRICSFLCSFEKFSQFEILLPKQLNRIGNKIKQRLEEKISILQKYSYEPLQNPNSLSTPKFRIILLSRTEKASPFVLSLSYGPLVQELQVVGNCKLLSAHSKMWNQMYQMDLAKIAEYLKNKLEQYAEGRQKKVNSVSLQESKKILLKAYNPELSKQQLEFHETLYKELTILMQTLFPLLTLQQSIANKITEQGVKLSGSQIQKFIQQWIENEKNNKMYERFLGLIMLALTVHKFWWFQKSELIEGLQMNDQAKVAKYQKSLVSQVPLKQLPPKIDNNNEQIRQDAFRHQPQLIPTLTQILLDIESNQLNKYCSIKINPSETTSRRTVRNLVIVYDTLGFNELAMMLNIEKMKNTEIVCINAVTTNGWTEQQLNLNDG